MRLRPVKCQSFCNSGAHVKKFCCTDVCDERFAGEMARAIFWLRRGRSNALLVDIFLSN